MFPFHPCSVVGEIAVLLLKYRHFTNHEVVNEIAVSEIARLRQVCASFTLLEP